MQLGGISGSRERKNHIYHLLRRALGHDISVLQIVDLDVLDIVPILSVNVLADRASTLFSITSRRTRRGLQ